MEKERPVQVVVAGGGFAGVEAAMYVKHRLGERAQVTLIADRPRFLFRPYLSYVPFGLVAEAVEVDLARIAQVRDFTFRLGRVQAVRPDAQAVVVDDEAVAFDYLVVATGAAPAASAVPGLAEQAYVLWHATDMNRLRHGFQEVLRAVEAGETRRIVFGVPPDCRWAGPLYEMVFMLAAWLQWQGARKQVTLALVSAEREHLSILGAGIHEVLTAELERWGIEVYLEHETVRVEAGALVFEKAERQPFDVLIAAPVHRPAVTWTPLPLNADGFVRTKPSTRQVPGHATIYAVGDASDYPVKQAFLALLQADAAAEHLAARVRDAEPAFAFEPQSIWVMDQLDQAVFARVPLGESDEATEVDRVPPGEIQRMLLGARLPQPFGESPLYAGLVWKGTAVGLRILSRLMDA